jgi:hypothetical protein
MSERNEGRNPALVGELMASVDANENVVERRHHYNNEF